MTRFVFFVARHQGHSDRPTQHGLDVTSKSKTGTLTRKHVLVGLGCLALATAMVNPASSARAEEPVLPVIPAVVPSVQPTGAAPADIEVNTLAAAECISAADARAILLAERKLPLFVNSARTRLGSSLGGVWVDHDRIKLGVVTPIDSALETSAEQVVDGVGLAGKVDIVPTPRGEAELVTLQNELDQQLVSVNDGAPVTIDVETDVQSSTVRLDVPPSPTAAQEQFVADVASRYGETVTKVAKPGPLVEYACTSGAWCDPPLRGGIRLVYGGAGTCSAGFVVRSLSDNVRYLSTAGHCVANKSGTWSTHFADNSSHDIGPRHNSGINDFAILEINNPTGWNPQPYIRIQSDQTYPITGYGSSVFGQRICFTGGFTDSNCGTVTGGLATRNGIPNTYEASFCAQNGDSGGAVFASNNAYGSLIGGYGGSPSCDCVYFSAGAFRDLNVVPVIFN
ncbi:S1 family peptidase [Nocardioides sp. NPDC126508]